MLGGDIDALQLDCLASTLGSWSRHVSKADNAALAAGNVEQVSLIEILQQPQRNLRCRRLDGLVRVRDTVPRFPVGAGRQASDRRHVRKCCPPDTCEGGDDHCHAASWRKVAAPADPTGCGDQREEGSFTTEAVPSAAGIEEFANFARPS